MTANVRIITNHHWRPFQYLYEFPEDDQKTIKSDYDYMEDETLESSYFFVYRNRFYSLDDFMSLHNKVHCPNPPDFMKGWDGYLNDSFFSGILIKLSEDGEFYQIATFY